ncbi:hypothetical protein G3N58_25430 [Paraburkholderia sp. Ac-20342]|uniref:hypothetical protein n=1 Tax=Paraburkholderia sp. Ac-20342 TaxID=2703889 RepID=UPI0019808247|nr:hypothetical protein [Paraburkholderia sp. Ac-20342]MBN3850136.1 hypothetical protein [Paraburkholderia sp. Ac-20342]
MNKSNITRTAGAIALVATLAGCASSSMSYTEPAVRQKTTISKTINRSRDAVWAAAVPALGKDFFVINNMDKASGLINVSYSGDPHSFVDCGHVSASFTNARGTQNYDFDGSDKDANYTQFKSPLLINLHRQMNLDGRINIIFEQPTPDTTTVTVNARYVLERRIQARANNGAGDSRRDEISFSSNGRAEYPALGASQTTVCVPTGRLEQDVLQLIN